MGKPGIAVLGCGYWGKNLIRNFYQIGVLKLVCDPSEAARARAREIAPGAKTNESFEAALGSPEIQGVVIATPAETHHRLTMRALEAGKDVFVEKPMALEIRDGEKQKALAEKYDAVLMVGHLLEYHGATLELRRLLDNDELGRVNYVYSNRLNFGKIRTEENALWSFAPHDVAVILRLLKEMPVEVTCVGGGFVNPPLADVTVSTLRFGSGRRAHIFVSWLNPFKEQKLVVVGEKRMAVFNDVSPEDKLVLYDQRVDLSEGVPILEKGGSRAISLPEEEPLRSECLHFLECMETRERPLTDAASGIRVLKVLQACQESMRENGAPIDPSGM